MVHKGEIVIKARKDGGWQFLSEDGRPYKEAYRENRPPCEWNALQNVHEAQGVYIDARTATARFRGNVGALIWQPSTRVDIPTTQSRSRKLTHDQ